MSFSVSNISTGVFSVSNESGQLKLIIYIEVTKERLVFIFQFFFFQVLVILFFRVAEVIKIRNGPDLCSSSLFWKGMKCIGYIGVLIWINIIERSKSYYLTRP